MKTSISPLWKELNIEDEVGLVAQLYDAYDEKLTVVEIVLDNSAKAKKYIETNSTICGVKDKGTINAFQIYKVLTPLLPHKFPMRDKSLDLDIFDMVVDWQELENYAGILHDQEAINPYGPHKQKILLREIILKLKSYYQSSEFPISEKTLGRYCHFDKPFTTIRGSDSPDHQIQFIEALKGLQKEGFIEIVDLSFDFSAELIEDRTREYIHIRNIGFASPFFAYLPAEHCQVVIRIMRGLTPFYLDETNEERKLENKEINVPTKKLADKTQLDEQIENSRANDWKLREEGKQTFLIFKDDVKFTFKSNGSIEYYYFKYLWDHYGKRMSYKDIYECRAGLTYPEIGKRARINSSITNTLHNILEKLYSAGVSQICIQVNRGYTLTIKN